MNVLEKILDEIEEKIKTLIIAAKILRLLMEYSMGLLKRRESSVPT